MTARRESMVGALAIAAVGAWFHNVTEGMGTASPETASAVLPTIALMGWWWFDRSRTLWWATLVWIGINLLVGAILSIVPLPVWPFVPDQSLGHHLAHFAYGVTQLPAIYLLWKAHGSHRHDTRRHHQ
ncbi:MAG: hypothetical protein WD156_07280 [Acidimicrobiia bacterium]